MGEYYMMRWMRILLVVGYWTLLGWLSADASDHLLAKSVTPEGASMPVRSARACSSEDLLGNWDLDKYDSSYRFKNQRAPYLFLIKCFNIPFGAVQNHSTPSGRLSGNRMPCFPRYLWKYCIRSKRAVGCL